MESIKRRAISLHSKYIKQRDGYKCAICGATENLECAHLFAGRHNALLFDTRPDGACHTLCRNCHRKSHSASPNIYEQWYVAKYGREKYEQIKGEANKIISADRDFYMEVIERLKNRPGESVQV